MPPPELPLEMRELLEQEARAGALEPLHDLADVLVRTVTDEQVHVIRGDLARDDVQVVLGRDLPQEIVYRWLRRGLLRARRAATDQGRPIWLVMADADELEHLRTLCPASPTAQPSRSPPSPQPLS